MIGTVVIPAKNEAATIGGIVKGALAYPEISKVVVVDDCSSDRTAGIAHMSGARVIPHIRTKGIAKCLIDGWAYAMAFKPDFIIQMDAGGSHRTEDLTNLLGADPLADLVIGSRFLHSLGHRGNPTRKKLSKLYASLWNLKVRGSFSDWTSGFRRLSPRLVRYLLQGTYKTTMHAFQADVLWRTAWSVLDFGIVEVPITYHAGESSLSAKATMEAIKLWLSR